MHKDMLPFLQGERIKKQQFQRVFNRFLKVWGEEMGEVMKARAAEIFPRGEEPM